MVRQKTNMRVTWLFSLVALTVVALICAPVISHAGKPKSPQVLPVNSNPHGASYGEWSARHWEWAFSLPADAHPLTDTADCSTGQSGHVWFLGGTFAATDAGGGLFVGDVDRECTIPSGTSLFFPILDVECSTIEGNGDTEEELRECAEFLADFIIPETLFLKIDGKEVDNLEAFRVQSPLFIFGPLPENNLLGAEAGAISPSVSDGYFVMLPPLPVGKHTIEFGGFLDAFDELEFGFLLDIKYDLTVTPRGRY